MRRAEAQDEKTGRTRRIACFALLFLIAFGVRLLAWHDARFEAARVQSAVAENYRHSARLIEQGGVEALFSAASPLADPDTLGHPPGYPIFLALVARRSGGAGAATPLIQIAADAAASALVFLLASELLSFGAGLLGGLLVALAPQFTWNSVLPLPDTLAALFVLLAVYFLARAARRPRLMTVMLAGASIGLSCWLRANALLLAPFLAGAAWLLFERGQRTRYALALVAGALVVVAPLTIRNALVFRAFIPVSLGAGQTLLEGIGDYDEEGRFGIPSTDLAIMRQEAEAAARPDYAETLFGPDAVKRERARLRRGVSFIAAHPLWFASVMARRAASMLRLERARTIQPRPPVTHALDEGGAAQLVWTQTPAELLSHGQSLSTGVAVSLAPDSQALRIMCDETKFARQFAAAPVAVEEGMDYFFRVPVKVERGRMSLEVTRDGDDAKYVSTIIETLEGKTAEEQPMNIVRLPFVSESANRVRLVLSNAPSDPPRPIAQIEEARLFKLGPASLLWTHYPRLVLSSLQKLFVTALMLPLAIAGLVMLLRRAEYRRALVLLLAVPVYYMFVQSALHTEYRYVLAIHYFLFIFAAFALCGAGLLLREGGRKIRTRPKTV